MGLGAGRPGGRAAGGAGWPVNHGNWLVTIGRSPLLYSMAVITLISDIKHLITT